MEQILRTLEPVELGQRIEECMDGTRKDVLATITAWTNNFDTQNILWLSGSPGAGKSTISSSVISTLFRNKRLASKFFFQRGSKHLTPSALWRTVAFHLSQFDSETKGFLARLLKENEIDLETPKLDYLFKQLIEIPVQGGENSLLQKHPVIVIDAVDECGDSNHCRALLKTLRRCSHLPRTFKILLTSRDDDDISSSLHDISHCVELRTGQRVTAESLGDIRLFFETRFADIVSRYPGELQASWPGKSVLTELTSQAAGLFIWAKTVVSFVDSDDHPIEQLSLIREGKIANADIDALYRTILDHAFSNVSSNLLNTFHKVVGTIIIAKDSISSHTLQHFLGDGVTSLDIRVILRKLRSVISAGQQDGLIWMCHQSFADCLIDPGRSKQFTLNFSVLCEHIVSQFNDEESFHKFVSIEGEVAQTVTKLLQVVRSAVCLS
jgi:hypothetical protein